MNICGLALKALKEIIDEKKSLRTVQDSFSMQYFFSSDEALLFNKTLHGSMRHFFLLRYQARLLYPKFEEDDDEIYLLIVALFQLRYARKMIASFQVIQEVVETNDFLELRFNSEELKKTLGDNADSKFTFPKEVSTDFVKYNSLMFSTPEWLIKMWKKQFGDDVMLNILRSNQLRHPFYVRRNHLKATMEHLLEEEIYDNAEACDDALVYSSPLSYAQQEDAKYGLTFPEDLSLQLVSDELYFNPGDRGLQLCGRDCSLSADIGIKLSSLKGALDVNFDNEQAFRKARYQYQRLGLKNVKAYPADLDMLRTYIPYNNYDVVIATPPSSNFGQINHSQSILLTIRKNDIPKLVKEQKLCLEEANRYLKKQGTIVYAISTINLDEGQKVIEDFLAHHMEYQLVTSRQIFCSDYNSDGLYFAVLTRG